MTSRGYRGRGRGRFQPQRNGVPPSWLFQGLSTDDLCSVPIPPLSYETEDDNQVEITDVVPLGSYNWADHPTPIIIVPGAPSLWNEPELPIQLSPDSGPSFIDQNSARSSKAPFEPAIRAISVVRGVPAKDLSLADEELDIVTDRNNLRKLMRFICSNGPNRDLRRRNREFRIDVQLAPNGKTLVLVRYDEKSIDESTGFKGYGHKFEEAATVIPPPIIAMNQTSTVISRLKSTGHHRIIRYDLLGLRFMVRFEIDAMAEDAPVLSETSAPQENNVDDLATLLVGTSISTASSTTVKPAARMPTKPAQLVSLDGSELRHVAHGDLVPQSSLVELTTLASKYEITWSDVYPQLFLSQTPVLKVAKHVDGRIDVIQTYEKDSVALEKAHANLSGELQALAKLLTRMREIAQSYKSTRKPLSFVWTGSGDLKVRFVNHRDNLLSVKDLSIF